MHLAFNCLMFFTYQASDFNNWEKWEILLCFHHTQWEVFFQIKFQPGMNSTCFIPGWNSHVNRNFFIPRWVSSWDEISSLLHVNALWVIQVCLTQSKNVKSVWFSLTLTENSSVVTNDTQQHQKYPHHWKKL